jgi:sugar-specific transcriptional regulator TrmB
MLDKQENKQKLREALNELGLHESETNLYLTSLTMGPASIATLAESLGIPRPNVYKAIAGLEQHGLARFSDRKKYVRTFVVEPPTVVLEKLRKKRDSVANLDHELVGMMPDLLANYHQGETPTKIKVLQGREQWLKIFFAVLDEESNESQFFGSAKDFVGFMTWDGEREWIKQRIAHGVFMKSLVLPSEEADLLQKYDAQELREIRVIKGLVPFTTSFQLFANKAIIWQPAGSLAILIEDEYIVAMLKSIFNKLWETSK